MAYMRSRYSATDLVCNKCKGERIALRVVVCYTLLTWMWDNLGDVRVCVFGVTDTVY